MGSIIQNIHRKQFLERFEIKNQTVLKQVHCFPQQYQTDLHELKFTLLQNSEKLHKKQGQKINNY